MNKEERKKLIEEIRKDLTGLDKDFHINRITVGDIEVVSSKEDLQVCSGFAQGLLRDKVIKRYLNGSFSKKKMLGIG